MYVLNKTTQCGASQPARREDRWEGALFGTTGGGGGAASGWCSASPGLVSIEQNGATHTLQVVLPT